VRPDLYTSRYAARTLIVESGLATVRISVGHPRWKLGYELSGACPLLAPTRDMLRLPIEEYRVRYEARLEAAGVETIAAALKALSEKAGGRGLVLLCFEDLTKPGEWCHRRLFADWWEKKTGRAVPELAAR
jgi:hypothetical protein